MSRRLRMTASLAGSALAVFAVLVAGLYAGPAVAQDLRPPIDSSVASGTVPSPRIVWSFSPGVMMDPLDPASGYGRVSEPAREPGEWYPLTRSGNSSGHPNFARRDATGRYLVWLPEVQPYGVALVAALEGSRASCQAIGWSPSPVPYLGTDITVSCHDAAGDPGNAAFAVTYTQGDSAVTAGGGYVRADRPTAPSYAPIYAYNPSAVPNTIDRTAVGTYHVRLPGLGGSQGRAEVAAYGASSHRCEVPGVTSDGADMVVDIRCSAGTGEPADATFAMAYVMGTRAD